MNVPAPIVKALEVTGSTSRAKVARWYNSLRFQKHQVFRQELFNRDIKDKKPQTNITNGWGYDESQSLPHLDQVFADSQAIINQNRLKTGKKEFMVDLLEQQDLKDYPSLLDFATSDDIINIASHYLNLVPILTSVKLLRSSPHQGDGPASSQQWHFDVDVKPQFKVIVHLNDITEDHGPFTLIPSDKSAMITKKIGYGKPGTSELILDSTIEPYLNDADIIQVKFPAKTVAYVDTGSCLHFGSRSNTKTRYLLMYQFVPPIRTDFRTPDLSEYITPNDSPLKQLALNKNLLATPQGS